MLFQIIKVHWKGWFHEIFAKNYNKLLDAKKKSNMKLELNYIDVILCFSAKKGNRIDTLKTAFSCLFYNWINSKYYIFKITYKKVRSRILLQSFLGKGFSCSSRTVMWNLLKPSECAISIIQKEGKICGAIQFRK